MRQREAALFSKSPPKGFSSRATQNATACSAGSRSKQALSIERDVSYICICNIPSSSSFSILARNTRS
jgi:hypothetical protein